MKKENGFSKIWIILLITAVIVIAGVAIIILNPNHGAPENNQNNVNNNKENIAKVQIPEKKYIRQNYDRQIYVNKSGEVLDFSSTISGIIEGTDFTYGTGIIKKDEKFAIVDGNGKIIADYGKYMYIWDQGLNYIAQLPNWKYVLLSKDGNVIGDKTYDLIRKGITTKVSQTIDGFYFAKDGEKSSIITATGCIVYETEETIEKETTGLWKITLSNNYVLTIKDKVFIINENQYNVTYSFKCNNLGIAKDYITDIDNEITYIFDNKGNMQLKLEDCLVNEDKNWEQFHSLYSGCLISNFLENKGYLIYKTKNQQYKVLYKDGSTVFQRDKNLSDKLLLAEVNYKYIIYKDNIWIQDGNNMLVYDKNKKIKVIENRQIPINYFDVEDVRESKIVPLFDKEALEVYLYNEKGEKINDIAYQSREYSMSVLEAKTGKEAIKPLFNGELMDPKEFTEIQVLKKVNSSNSYSENYFLGTISVPKDNEVVNDTKDYYYLIDKECNKILQIKVYTKDLQLDEEQGICIYQNADREYCLYDLKQKKELFKSKHQLTYLPDYRIVTEGGVHTNIYSLATNKLYTYI